RLNDDIESEMFPERVVYSEVEFKQMSENGEENFHFLLRGKGRLFWIQSNGSISNLAKYRKDEFKSMDDYLLTEDDIIDMSGNQDIRIISDSPGMGKTTVLSSLSRKIKAVKPSRWVIKVNLNDRCQVLEDEVGNR